MVLLIGAIALAYLLGSLSGSLLLGRLRGVDIRREGSGNAGGTNAFRTQGWRFALGVVVIDVGKGALAAWLGLHAGASAPSPLDSPYAQGALCGFAAVLGHCWPLFFGFRGGKGAGTAAGALIVLAPPLVLPLVGVWALVLIATGYVGLATIIAALVFALLAATTPVVPAPAAPALAAFAIALAVLIVFTHRENLVRLRRGEEFRFEKARLLHRVAQRLRAKMWLLVLCVPAGLGAPHAAAATNDDGIAAAARMIQTQAAHHRLILLGELHGTREIPRLVAALVRTYSTHEPVLLGLEVHETEAGALRRYLASDGGTKARWLLEHSDFWHVANTEHDGRRNDDMLDLIEQIRRLRVQGRAVDVLAFDNPAALQVDSPTRDRLMAERLRAAYATLQRGRLLVLTGNVHAMLGRPSYAPPEMQAPMGSYLRDLEPYSVDISAASGETWMCRPQCGAAALPGLARRTGPDHSGAYDFDVVLPRFTIARMIGSKAETGK